MKNYNYYLVLLPLIMFLFSCQNNSIKPIKKIVNGDTLFIYEFAPKYKMQEIYIHKSDGSIEHGFLKENKNDSIRRAYDSNGKLISESYFINGLFNGFYTKYTKNGNEGIKYFMENDTALVKYKYYYIEKNSKQLIGKEIETYFGKDSLWEYTGSLCLNNDHELMDSLFPCKSSYFYINGEQNMSKVFLAPVKTRSRFNIRFFRFMETSNVSLSINEVNIQTGTKINYTKVAVDPDGYIDYYVEPKNKGWKFLRGEFIETWNNTELRIVPFFFNYYVY